MHTLIMSDQELRTVRHALQAYIDDESDALLQILGNIGEGGVADPDEIISYGADIRSAGDLMARLPDHPKLP
jgi:hypothetical protein